MKTRMTILTLTLCLLLTACGGKGQTSKGQMPFSEETVKSEEEASLLTVDGRKVPTWRYVYWLLTACEQTQAEYEAAGTELDWDTPVSEGTLGDCVKQAALADTALYATVENWAAAYGYVPGETEEHTIALPNLGFGPAQMAELEEVRQMYAWLYRQYQDGKIPLTPTEETLRTYGTDCGAMTVNRILVAADKDRETARQRAAELFSQLNGAKDPASTFATLAAAGGDPAGSRTILPSNTSLAPELLAAAKALEEGQTSGILESQEGFSILRREPLDTNALREEYFDHLLTQAAAAAAVTTLPAYETLDPAAVYETWRENQSAANRT